MFETAVQVPIPCAPDPGTTAVGGRRDATGPAVESLDEGYESYWRLTARPFENVPDPCFYVPSVKHETAKERLRDGIINRKGIVVLTGEIGSGKTLLSRSLIQSLPPSRYEVGLIANPSVPEREWVGEILYQLGSEAGGAKTEQLRRLNERLLANDARGCATVIFVDEAQAITEDHVFEELRLLTNFQLNDRFLLTLVLLGQPELLARLRRIPQFAQRVAICARLDRFDRNETATYVRGRLAAAGCIRDLFSSGALTAIHRYSGGVCRLINVLCDRCLHHGRLARVMKIRKGLVARMADGLLALHEADGYERMGHGVVS